MVFRDVTEERKREEEIIYLSYHDRLTGLYNRAFFEEELMRQDAKGQLPLSLIMGDVNGLKISNDVFGHQEGDRMLQAIAEVLKEPVEPRMFWLDGEATNSSFCCPELRIKLRRQSVSE